MLPETFQQFDDSHDLDDSWVASNKSPSPYSRCETISLMDMLDVPNSAKPVAIVEEIVKRKSSSSLPPTKPDRQITIDDLSSLLGMMSFTEDEDKGDDVCNMRNMYATSDTLSTRSSSDDGSCGPSQRNSTIRDLADLFALFEEESEDIPGCNHQEATTSVLLDKPVAGGKSAHDASSPSGQKVLNRAPPKCPQRKLNSSIWLEQDDDDTVSDLLCKPLDDTTSEAPRRASCFAAVDDPRRTHFSPKSRIAKKLMKSLPPQCPRRYISEGSSTTIITEWPERDSEQEEFPVQERRHSSVDPPRYPSRMTSFESLFDTP